MTNEQSYIAEEDNMETQDQASDAANLDKRTRSSDEFINLVQKVSGIKILMLSATPVFDQPREIIWLLNVMNQNDGKPPINAADIFDSKDQLKIGPGGEEIGKQNLIKHAGATSPTCAAKTL